LLLQDFEVFSGFWKVARGKRRLSFSQNLIFPNYRKILKFTKWTNGEDKKVIECSHLCPCKYTDANPPKKTKTKSQTTSHVL